jgi:hypothetical protein
MSLIIQEAIFVCLAEKYLQIFAPSGLNHKKLHLMRCGFGIVLPLINYTSKFRTSLA